LVFSPLAYAKESIEFLLQDILVVKVTLNNESFKYTIAVGINDDNKKIGYIVEWQNLVTKQKKVTLNYNSFTNNNAALLFSLMQTGLTNEIKKQIGKFIIIENNLGFNIHNKSTRDPLKLQLISNLKLDLLYEIKGTAVSLWAVDNLERTLIIETSENGASIYINEKFVGLSPLKVTFKGRVTITIRAEKKGFLTQEIVLSLKKVGENKILIELNPFDNLDRIIKIRSFPSTDAEVYFNDIFIGSTPLTYTIKGNTIGIITLKKNNLSTSIYIDGTKSGEYEIPVYFDSEIRKISFITDEKDAVLFINGKPFDFIPCTFEFYGEQYFIGQVKTKTKISSYFLIYANPNESKVMKIFLNRTIIKKTFEIFDFFKRLFLKIF